MENIKQLTYQNGVSRLTKDSERKLLSVSQFWITLLGKDDDVEIGECHAGDDVNCLIEAIAEDWRAGIVAYV